MRRLESGVVGGEWLYDNDSNVGRESGVHGKMESGMGSSIVYNMYMCVTERVEERN